MAGLVQLASTRLMNNRPAGKSIVALDHLRGLVCEALATSVARLCEEPVQHMEDVGDGETSLLLSPVELPSRRQARYLRNIVRAYPYSGAVHMSFRTQLSQLTKLAADRASCTQRARLQSQIRRLEGVVSAIPACP